MRGNRLHVESPEFSNRDKAYFILGECFIKANKPAEALPYFDRLVKEFEKSEYLELAKKRIDELKASKDTPKGALP